MSDLAEVERAAEKYEELLFNDPVVKSCHTLVQLRLASEVEALKTCVVALALSRKELQDRVIKLEQNAPLATVMPFDKIPVTAKQAMEHEYREFKDAVRAAGLRAVRVGTRLVIIGA